MCFQNMSPLASKLLVKEPKQTFGYRVCKSTNLTDMQKVFGVPVSRHSGGQLEMTLVATLNDFPFFSSCFCPLCRLLFSYKECTDQKTYLVKVDGSVQNLWEGTFPDPVSHFGAP